MRAFDYSGGPRLGTCEAGARAGVAGGSDAQRSASGVRYDVRTPSNYDAKRRHPLLMVYAPAGASAQASEAASGLTPLATAAGFVVAYADHVRLGVAGAQRLASIPTEVAARWCIDERHVYLTGHSDGGTIANIVAVMPQTRSMVAGLAPSAAGVVAADLDAYGCRLPTPVMVMHAKNDALFPGFGEQVARWWARCNGCAADATHRDHAGCLVFDRCAAAAPTRYCEGEQGHAKWPRRGEEVMKFFSAQLR